MPSSRPLPRSPEEGLGVLRRRLVPLLPRSFREGVRRIVGQETPYMIPAGGVPKGVAPWQVEEIAFYADPSWHDLPHFRGSQELVLEYLGAVLAHSAGGVALLDAPCGNGRLYRGLSNADLLGRIRYVGLDATPNVVQAARGLMPDVEIHEGSVEALPFPAASFDVVVAQHIIRHLESYEQAVRELLRVSRWLTIIVEKDAAKQGHKLGTGYSAKAGAYWTNAWDSAHLKTFARANGASVAFTLNDATQDDPDAQYIYAFYR